MSPIWKVLQALGVFVSFAFVLFGTLVMIAMNLEVLSRSLAPEEPTWTIYHLNFISAPLFYLGCGMVAAGLTFLWLQKKK
jgi:hypothetical protein